MKASPRLIAANLDDAQQRDAIREMTRDYFNWMNGEIKRAIGLTISDITGMDQNAYLTGMLETLCATRPPESVFHLVELEGEWAGMGGLRRLEDGSAEIVRVYTRPACRGCGIGRWALAESQQVV